MLPLYWKRFADVTDVLDLDINGPLKVDKILQKQSEKDGKKRENFED